MEPDAFSSSNRIVMIDACVLSEAAVSDLLLRLALPAGVIQPRWSDTIVEETLRTWIEDLDWPPAIAKSRIEAADIHFPEANVKNWEKWLPKCQNHPKDRHVLAAAIEVRAGTILTFNVKDFPETALSPWNIKASHPDAFLQSCLDSHSDQIQTTIRSMAQRARRSDAQMLGRFAWSLPKFAGNLARQMNLDLPSIAPAQWRT